MLRGKVVPCEPLPDPGPLPPELRPTKLQLAAQMIVMVATCFPDQQFRVLVDHDYYGKALLKTVHDEVKNLFFVLRGHDDAALYL